VQPPPVKVLRADWQGAMSEAGVDYLEGIREQFTSDSGLLERVVELAEQTYSQASYNERR
jgi:hypothetical protein